MFTLALYADGSYAVGNTEAGREFHTLTVCTIINEDEKRLVRRAGIFSRTLDAFIDITVL